MKNFKINCAKCVDYQNENAILKENVLLLEKDEKCMLSQISSLENKNVSLKEISSISKNENEILKEKIVFLEKENLLLKKNDLKYEKEVCSTKFNYSSKTSSFPKIASKKKDFLKKKYFSHGLSKKNIFSENLF